MAYTRRYAGGFIDSPPDRTLCDSQYLNKVEDSLIRLDSVDPAADGQVLQWIAGTGGKYGPALLLNKNVDPAAAIAWSKLATTGAISNPDVAGAAAIAWSKLATAGAITNADVSPSAAISPSKLAGYPNDANQALKGDGTWGQASSPAYHFAPVTIGPNAPAGQMFPIATQVIPANTLGTNKCLKCRFQGDIVFPTQPQVRITVSWGGALIFDDTSGNLASSATRRPMVFSFTLGATDATHQQLAGDLRIGSGTATVGLGDLSSAIDTELSSIASNGLVNVDSTVAQTLIVSMGFAVLAAYDIRMHYGIAEVSS